MRKSVITAEFAADVQTVWDIVTNLEDTSWRSDLSRTEHTEDGKTFVEYTREGYATKFTITERTPCRRYAFGMENKNFTGQWSGAFTITERGGTRITFTEEIQVRSPVMEFLSRFTMNLKKTQQRYVHDLRRKLGE